MFIELTDKEFKLLKDTIAGTDDEGPPGEGWKSSELAALWEKLEAGKNEPAGNRDLYWCWFLNEPVIIEYRDDAPYCRNCCGSMDPDTHQFMIHLTKPIVGK